MGFSASFRFLRLPPGWGDRLAVGCLRASGVLQGWRATVENLSSLPDAFVDNWSVWFVGDATRQRKLTVC